MSEGLTESMQVLFQKSHIEALVINGQQVGKWELYRNELHEVRERLNNFLRHLNLNVMVPVGNKALFRGKLVHTNDIMISLGDGYFTKGSVEQATEIISRRISKCDETLDKLHKERALLESRTLLRSDNDVFPSKDNREIVEEFAEDEEAQWRNEHRKKVRDYKQKLAQMKEEESSEIRTDEDLWKRLEILEMEEELNDELDRLGSEDSDSSGEYTDTDSSDQCLDESTPEPIYKKPEQPCSNKSPRASIITKNKSDDDYIKIPFKHSSRKTEIKEFDGTINSPYDIYSKFSNAFNITSKRNVKTVRFADTPEIKLFKTEQDDSVRGATFADTSEKIFKTEQNNSVAFGEVMERTDPSSYTVTNSRPVSSKFKSERHKLH